MTLKAALNERMNWTPAQWEALRLQREAGHAAEAGVTVEQWRAVQAVMHRIGYFDDSEE